MLTGHDCKGNIDIDEMATGHPFADFCPRALGLLALGDGIPVRDITHILRTSKQTIYQRFHDGRRAGLAGILSGHTGDRPSVLTETMIDTAVAAVRVAEFDQAKVVLERFTSAARGGDVRVMVYDESGFAATPNMQRAWAPIRHPHATTPVSHAKRVSVIGALDIVANQLISDTAASTVNRQKVVDFLDRLALGNNGRPLIVVRDNAKIHHHIDPDITHR